LLIVSTAYASHGVIAKFWSLLKPRRAADRTELEPKTDVRGHT
jgi:hypothetical protein